MTSRFRKLVIRVDARPFSDALGRPVASYPLVVGSTLKHWADPALAMAWFQRALAILDDQAVTNAPSGRASGRVWPSGLGEPLTVRTPKIVPFSVLNALPITDGEQQFLQSDYMFFLMEAIRNGFNALNIVWSNDPTTRALYREYISGPPKSPNGNPNGALYNREQNYADGWFTPQFDMPRIQNGTGGSIPRKARETFLSHYHVPDPSTHANLFQPSAGLSLTYPPGMYATSVNVDLAQVVTNGSYAIMQRVSRSSRPENYPDFGSQVPGWNGATSARSTFEYHINPAPGGIAGPDDWRITWFQSAPLELNPLVELNLMAGMADYLPYLRAIVEGALARTPEQIIQDSRAFCAYTNHGYITQFESVDAFLRASLLTPADVQSQQSLSRPGVEMAANLAFTLGGALAAETYGISALVGGAVGATLIIADKVIPNEVLHHGRDDLGRWKPTFERAWLDGDPYAADGGVPQIEIPNPPGFADRLPALRPLSEILSSQTTISRDVSSIPEAQRQPGSQTSDQSGNGSHGQGQPGGTPKKSIVPWVVGGLLVAGAIRYLKKS